MLCRRLFGVTQTRNLFASSLLSISNQRVFTLPFCEGVSLYSSKDKMHLPDILSGSYKQYKEDTNIFTTWLSHAASAIG